MSPMRRFKHCFVKILNSISAASSQLREGRHGESNQGTAVDVVRRPNELSWFFGEPVSDGHETSFASDHQTRQTSEAPRHQTATRDGIVLGATTQWAGELKIWIMLRVASENLSFSLQLLSSIFSTLWISKNHSIHCSWIVEILIVHVFKHTDTCVCSFLYSGQSRASLLAKSWSSAQLAQKLYFTCYWPCSSQ